MQKRNALVILKRKKRKGNYRTSFATLCHCGAGEKGFLWGRSVNENRKMMTMGGKEHCETKPGRLETSNHPLSHELGSE